MAVVFGSCSRPITTSDGSMGFPIQLAKTNYQIPVYFSNQHVDLISYQEIGKVKVEKEVELAPAETKQRRMIYRGNNEDQKRALLDQLIIQAVAMEASAIVNVTYKYYTAATYQGFVLEGVAVKFKKSEE